MVWAAVAAIGLDILKGAKDEIESHIAQVMEASKTVVPLEFQPAYFTSLQGKKASLYVGASKDSASSLFSDANAGNDVAMTVSTACNAAKVPAHYRFKLRAAVYSIFGNSGKAALEEKKAADTPPPPVAGAGGPSLSVGGTAISPAMMVGGAVLAYLLLKKK